MWLEGWHLFDALYMTIITLSTVGFGEVRSLSPAGRVFTALLIVGGVVVVTMLFSAVSHHIVSGELTGLVRRKRMRKAISELRGHFVVCGYGRVGEQVTRDLLERHQRVVVIEPRMDPTRLIGDLLHIDSDAAQDEALIEAGIERAWAVVVATGDDPTNLFVAMSARSLNPDVVVVARANDCATESKLRRAGATYVVSPYRLSGQRIAEQLLAPTAVEFIDQLQAASAGVHLEEVPVCDDSPLHRRGLDHHDVRVGTGANVLAVRRMGHVKFPGSASDAMAVQPGDILVALGSETQLRALAVLAGAVLPDRFRRQTAIL